MCVCDSVWGVGGFKGKPDWAPAKHISAVLATRPCNVCGTSSAIAPPPPPDLTRPNSRPTRRKAVHEKSDHHRKNMLRMKLARVSGWGGSQGVDERVCG